MSAGVPFAMFRAKSSAVAGLPVFHYTLLPSLGSVPGAFYSAAAILSGRLSVNVGRESIEWKN